MVSNDHVSLASFPYYYENTKDSSDRIHVAAYQPTTARAIALVCGLHKNVHVVINQPTLADNYFAKDGDLRGKA